MGKRARLRTVPEMTFVEDAGAERGGRIAELLEEARRTENPPDAEDVESQVTDAG
jgi:ribosome-binding factor A